jgi:CcmD family protein
MKNYEFLFWGYLVVWAGLAIYFFVMMRKVAGLTRRLDALETRAKRAAPSRTT